MWTQTVSLHHSHTGTCSHILCTSSDRSRLPDIAFVLQLAAQVLDEFDDEDVGFGLLDAKHDKAVAKKLGKCSTEEDADTKVFM